MNHDGLEQALVRMHIHPNVFVRDNPAADLHVCIEILSVVSASSESVGIWTPALEVLCVQLGCHCDEDVAKTREASTWARRSLLFAQAHARGIVVWGSSLACV